MIYKILISMFLFIPVLLANDNCDKCSELAILKKEVKLTAKSKDKSSLSVDTKAIKIINHIGAKKNSKLSEGQALHIVQYLAASLPLDPSRSMVEAIWPTISRHPKAIKEAVKKLSKEDKEEVLLSIKNYDLMMKQGNDPIKK